MTSEELKELQAKMTDEELIQIADKQLSEMCKTGGRSFRMTVPVEIKDTDMIFSELIRRFQNKIKE